MAMGKRRPAQQTMWVAPQRSPGHPFYQKLNALLDEAGFDRWVEGVCEQHYAPDSKRGSESIPPGVYFRMLFIGYFEGIESERGIEWRCADSLSLRDFLGLPADKRVPDHSTLSRTRTRLPASVYEEVFRFVLVIVERKGLLKGKVAGVDSTYLRADASMKAIVRKDTGEGYKKYLRRLAQESGIEDPTEEDLRRMDRRRKGKKTSNRDWKSGTDEDARIARLKDGRTRLAYKPEQVVDLETGAILSTEVYRADQHDTATIEESLEKATANVEHAKSKDDDDDDDDNVSPAFTTEGEPWHKEPKMEVAGDKGYFKAEMLTLLKDKGYRTYIPEPKRRSSRRRFTDKGGAKTAQAVHQNLARTKRKKGKDLQRRRGELLERPFAHMCETGGQRRVRLRGRENVQKRWVMQAAAANLGLVMRSLYARGTPRGLAAARRARLFVLFILRAFWAALVTVMRSSELAAFGYTPIASLVTPKAPISTGC